MTLTEFLKECKKNGTIPLNYRSEVHTLTGKKITEYENPAYARIKKQLGIADHPAVPIQERAGMREKRQTHLNIEDIVSDFKGEEVVIHTKDGYHFGRLKDYNGKSFRLERYYFDNEPIDTFEYASRSIFSKDSVVPAEDIISVSKIPLHVDRKY